MTALTSPARPRGATGGGPTTGTATLVGLLLRRDRIKLPAWILGITVFVPYFYGVVSTLAAPWSDTQPSVDVLASPMIRLFVGPVFGLEAFTPARYFVAAYFQEFLLAAAVMNILLVARHTRAEEQSGRAELVRAAVVGRHAPLTAALLLAAIADAALCLLIASAAWGIGFPAGSALLFGAGIAATGLVFAGITAVTVQLTESSRLGAGLSSVVLAVAWAVRATGALQAEQGGTLTWFSPLAWPLLTRVLADERWWPLVVALMVAAACVAAAYALSARRDLGAGVVAPRAGAAGAAEWLRSPFALVVRLQRRAVIWWGVALVVAGLSYGGITAAVDDAVPAALGEGPDPARGYLSLMVVMMTFVVCVFTIRSVHVLRDDETGGRAEALLATATSRQAWLGSALAAAALAGTFLLLLTGLATGVSASVATGDGRLFGELVAAYLVRAPEVLLLAGLAAALFGLAPRAIGLTWAVLVHGGIVRFFAPSLDWPAWLMNTSPFQHIPRLPLEEFHPAPALALTALALALALLGLRGIGSRDLRAG